MCYLRVISDIRKSRTVQKKKNEVQEYIEIAPRNKGRGFITSNHDSIYKISPEF